MNGVKARIARALLLLMVTSSIAAAQDPTPGTDLPTDARSTGSTKNSGVIVIPVVGAGPTFGLGGGAVPAYVFRMDSASPRSAVAVGGLLAERSSWLVSVGGRLDFQRDNWHTLFGYARYDVHYPFFGVGNAAGDANQSVILQQDGNAGMIEGLHRVVGPLYLGVRYRFDDVSIGLDRGDHVTPFGSFMRTDSSVSTTALGIAGAYDSRDDEMSPRHGTFAQGTAMYARTWLGGDRAINSYEAWFNQYVPVKQNAVLALRASVCDAGNEAPVWQLCTFGARNDLRGYTVGRYRDHALFAVQGEYRVSLAGRFGFSVFAGTGEVAPSWSGITTSNLLVSGGPGVRYLVSRSHRLNFGADYAFASHGGAYYFRIGEAY